MISMAYATSLLGALIAVQMAILGRFMYLRVLLANSNINCDKIHLDEISEVGKAIMTISTRFVNNGAEHIDQAVVNATNMILSKMDVQDSVSRSTLNECIQSIRHEIEDAPGRDIIEESLLGHDAIRGVYSLLTSEQKPLATLILEKIKRHLSSPLFKQTISKLVQKKIDKVMALACEELYVSMEEPLLLAIVPNINGESRILTTAKILVDDDPPLTALMAIIYKSVNNITF